MSERLLPPAALTTRRQPNGLLSSHRSDNSRRGYAERVDIGSRRLDEGCRVLRNTASTSYSIQPDVLRTWAERRALGPACLIGFVVTCKGARLLW
jgi:hypothetical protein